MMKTVTEVRFGKYREDDKSVTLRSKSGTCGGGSEVLVIRFLPTDESRRDGIQERKVGCGCSGNKPRVPNGSADSL